MNTARSSDSGFTLVEILMVLFIIGLAASLVVMTVPERTSGLEEDAADLQRDVYTLSDRAVLTGIPHAIEFTDETYRSVLWQRGAWVPFAQVENTLSEGVSLKFPDRDSRKKSLPLIIFDPVGVPSEARIELSARGQTREIALNRNQLGQGT